MLFPIAKGKTYRSRWKSPGTGSAFGAERGGGGRLHAGCDIGCEWKTEVVAIDAGEVVERGDKPFIRGSQLYALAVRHDCGVIARYTEIFEIPAHLKRGTKVSAGETMGLVAFQSDGCMLHFELYADAKRKGWLSVPWGVWPRKLNAKGKRVAKAPDELTVEERGKVRGGGYLPDFMRRDDLSDPTDFLIKLEKGTPIGSDKAATAALIGLTFLHNPALGLAQIALALRAKPEPELTGPIGETGGRDYSGVTGLRADGGISTTEPPPREYEGPLCVALPEPD